MAQTLVLLGTALGLPDRGARATAMTAMTVCAQFSATGVAADCKNRTLRNAASADAAERVVFDSPRTHGRVGEILRFVDPICIEATMEMLAPIAGVPRRYCSRSALIFVELNTTAVDIQAKTDRIVGSL